MTWTNPVHCTVSQLTAAQLCKWSILLAKRKKREEENKTLEPDFPPRYIYTMWAAHASENFYK